MTEITNVGQAIALVRVLDRSNDFAYAYRGQLDIGWKPIPSILRSDAQKLLASEKQAIRDVISLHPTEFEADTSMFDRLVRIQHYGMPNRLLDVTTNPLVALYFAVSDEEMDRVDGSLLVSKIPPERVKYYDSDAVSCLANLANLSLQEKEAILQAPHRNPRAFNASQPIDRLLQFIRAEKPYFRADIDPVDLFRPCYVVAKKTNRRILAQAGAFLIYGLDGDAGGPAYDKNLQHTPYKIPAASKATIRLELEDLSINSSSLFPEIESAATYIKSKYM